MTLSNRFRCRSNRRRKQWAIVSAMAVIVSTFGGPAPGPAVHAQGGSAAVGFVLDAGDLRFIFRQIEIAEAHAAGGQLFGPGPNQVREPRLPFGLRTVDGSFNHIAQGQELFGAADQVFPRLTTRVLREAEQGTSYAQPAGTVIDSRPRIISNLIVDQTTGNPAAVAAAGPNAVPDPLGTLPIPNVAPDAGLSAPFNIMFTFFGQFFDHGLDLVNKGGSGVVVVPLTQEDPLFVPGSSTNFMVLTRATHLPGPDGVRGTADDINEGINQTTPFVDQNQTYTSHPSHQVFLREYRFNADGIAGTADDNRPRSTGRMIDGGGTIGAVPVKNIGNWAEVKAQARNLLGIALVDRDVFNIPLIAADPYGRFLRGPNGFPLLIMQDGTAVEGNRASPISTAGARRINHGFLDDIAHNAVPRDGLVPDADTVPNSIFEPRPQGTYDDELLAAHLITGDGRGNENIALTSVHTIFHAEHNRLRDNIDQLINTSGFLTTSEVAAWKAQAAQPPSGSGWDYGERLFQAAKFVTEMQYQHLVFEEFARKLVPSINEFIGDGINFQSDTNPAIPAEFAHQTYRLGHSMLTETISRTNQDGTTNDIPLLNGFLNPLEFNNGGSAGQLTAAQAAGAIFQGGTRQVGMEIDEFVTEAVRNNLLGLPLDLATINLARGRSEGVAPLNAVRRDLHLATEDPQLTPYTDWADFGFSIKHGESLVNLIAAYGIHPSLQAATTIAEKRAAANTLVNDSSFMFADGRTTGVENIDLWVGGLAEKIAPFGSMLGTTFTHIFEHTLENLQNNDRFYYLERLDGLNLLAQLEGNSFAELISRNTTLRGPAADVFSRPDFVFNLTQLLRVPGRISDDPTTPEDEAALAASGELVLLANGTVRYLGAAHVIWNGISRDANGNPVADRVISSEGDDTLRGDDGNDVMEGGAGNDNHIGGAGNDILTDTFGEDVMKGGPGNDAIAGGSGPFDLLQGNEGNDFIVGGNDASEVFGGPGNDIFYVGKGLSESFGGAGDDWIEGSDSPASVLVGDENNQFQNDPNGGHDVIIAGPGDADFDSEGGDDIMVANVLPTHRLEGMLGYDWATYRGDPTAVDADMLVSGALEVFPDINELRDRFDLTEGLSGWIKNDILRGDHRGPVELANGAFGTVPDGHVLKAAGIARITGLAALLPPGATEFRGGNIILGGAGSDFIEGRGGDDIIDGDRWLNVQLRATDITGAVRLFDSLQQAKTDVFAGRILPGAFTIVRSIVTDPPVAPDCGVAEPVNCDVAMFSGPVADYVITRNADGSLTVAHQGTSGVDDGTDILRNIEVLRFSDGDLPASQAAQRPTLSVIRTGTGGGTVTSSPAGITCGADCSEAYASGTAVTLTASPAAGSIFGGWTGCDTVSGASCTITMSAARSVNATFNEQTFALSVTKAGAGTGTVTSSPAGINCGADCSESYARGTAVTLTASPALGSTFIGWTGCATVSGSTCTVTMSAVRSVAATFNLQNFALTVTKSGLGAGTVTSTPAGINCGSDCSESYAFGTTVTLKATPSLLSGFDGWSGCDAVSGTTCTVRIDRVRSVQASFRLIGLL
jgi:Ca2+-binding RTX toxin-like protein